MHIKSFGILLLVIIILLWQGIVMPQSNTISNKSMISNNNMTGISDSKLNKIGLEKLKENKFHDAEQYFLHAILKNPSIKYYYNNLSVVYMNQERFNEAYRNLEIAIRIDPNYVKALSNMAITCFYMFNFIESYKYYLAARKVDRDSTIRRFDKEKAELKIRELHDKNPDNANLKRIMDRLKNYSEK
jgi:tetratricopeptide (TPR) repeat protein